MADTKKKEDTKKTIKKVTKTTVAKKTVKKVTPKKTTSKVIKKVTAKKSAPKKTIIKKTAKKITPKTSVNKINTALSESLKSEKSKKIESNNDLSKKNINWLQGHMVLVSWAFSVFLLGALLGSLSMNGSMVRQFDAGNERVVTNGYTWLPVKGEPVELVILNDKTCGQSCETKQSVAALKQNISLALIERTVDVSSPEGIKLIAEHNISTIPQYFFGKGFEDIKNDKNESFAQALPEGVVTKKGALYALNNAAIGFPTGKFITAPKFKDLKTEPTKGTGKIQVVEFTDYQCPYCKRLHDQNKSLIDRLVAEGKITYTLKDFPLGFHKESPDAHKAANCVLKLSDNDTYWTMNSQIFATTDSWNRKGIPAAKKHFKKLATTLGIDGNKFDTCVNSAEISQEMTNDQIEGQKYGVRGTPALFIGTQSMPGAIGAAAFEKAVNDELKK